MWITGVVRSPDDPTRCVNKRANKLRWEPALKSGYLVSCLAGPPHERMKPTAPTALVRSDVFAFVASLVVELFMQAVTRWLMRKSLGGASRMAQLQAVEKVAMGNASRLDLCLSYHAHKEGG